MGFANRAQGIRQEEFSFEKFVSSITSVSNIASLQDYYKGTPFAKSEKLNRFLSWVRKNDADLVKELKKDVASGLVSGETEDKNTAIYLLSIWLGGRYVASSYKQEGREQKFPKLVVGDLGFTPSERPFASRNSFQVFVPPGALREIAKRFDYKENIDMTRSIIGLNIGIHEYAHKLNEMNGGKGTLSEMATYLIGSQLALPLKTPNRDDSLTLGNFVNFWEGSRFFQHTWNEIARGGRVHGNLRAEYLAHAIGPWVQSLYEKNGKEIAVLSLTKWSDENLADLQASVNDDEKGFLDWLYQIFFGSSEITSGKDICKTIGLMDPDLEKKFDSVLAELRNAKNAGAIKAQNMEVTRYDESGFVNMLKSKQVSESDIREVLNGRKKELNIDGNDYLCEVEREAIHSHNRGTLARHEYILRRYHFSKSVIRDILDGKKKELRINGKDYACERKERYWFSAMKDESSFRKELGHYHLLPDISQADMGKIMNLREGERIIVQPDINSYTIEAKDGKLNVYYVELDVYSKLPELYIVKNAYFYQKNFINLFIELMNKYFGKPKDDIPPGFVYTLPEERQNDFFKPKNRS